ncbi:hypothetical protein JCM30760_03450 [Thiomicrorhabdus hydrogeniphila]
MRKTVTTLALSLSLIAPSVFADESTLSALQAAGVALTDAQATSIQGASCSAESCAELTEQISALIASNQTNDATVESILRAASSAHPENANQFGDAAMAAAPDQTALIAGLMSELAPTAAGGNGPIRARIRANFNNNIPTSPGGGGSSSPS